MRGRRGGWLKAGAATAALALLVVGAVVAQDPAPPAAKGAMPADPNPNPNPKGKVARKGGLRLPGRAPAKGLRKGADPLANPVNVAGLDQPLAPGATFHYRFKIAVGDNEPLMASYYPSKLGTSSAVVMLVHEKERSSRDFEEPIEDLKKYTLAEHLQKQGYAVLAVDLRGHGGSQRRTLSRSEWSGVPNDLQSAYYCLVDRHNWGELNLAKLGVVAVGEGANVAVNWAASPGGAVSSEGRTGDLAALILVSPMVDAQGQGLRAASPINAMAARVPLALMVGERDASSFPLVAACKPFVKRFRSNLVETFPSGLHGYKMFSFEPKMTAPIVKFLDDNIKGKGDEWEGRYLLNPVRYTEIKRIANPVRGDPAAAKKAAR